MTRDTDEDTGGTYRHAIRRRSVLKGVAAGSIAGIGGVTLAQGDEPVPVRLGGETSGWTVPEDFDSPVVSEGPNPTLNLEAGTEYEVTWTNLDGAQHNFAILDADENVLRRTDIMGEEGATQTTTFTASEEMATYLCQVHPVSMRGDISLGGAQGGAAQQQQGGQAFFEQGTEVGVQVVAEGMTAPTDFAAPAGDQQRYYVSDQTGEVWVVDQDGRLDQPFVDVSDRMVTLGKFWGSYADPDQAYDERGLLGIDFHPDYPDTRQVYLHYSAPPDGVEGTLPDGWDHWEVVSEFEVADDGLSADPDSERRLLEIPKPQYNHDAGPMAFGPDGYLYVPMGDGGGANDDMYGHVEDWYDTNAGGNGQDVEENMLGNILRIDVDSESGDKPYGIPEDNPFAGEDNPGLDEIYAYGFRNPFGVSFDSEGHLFQADAGQNLFEEADVVEKGGNYGWNVKEGTHCFSTENPSDANAITDCPETEPDEPPYDGSELQDPIVEYPHTYQGQNVGIVIVGGHRYENDQVGGLQGKYVFGEWTKDPARGKPMGRVLTAAPPADFGQGMGADGGMGNQSQAGNESMSGNGTMGGNGSMDANTTQGNSTGAEDQVVPRDELWEMRELRFAKTEGGTLGRFVRMFGRVFGRSGERGAPGNSD